MKVSGIRTDEPGGKKEDLGKTRWDLLPTGTVRSIAQVLTFGAGKYGDNNWQGLPNARSRYYAAAQRHLDAWWADGEVTDPESGLPHLAHAACCLLFLIWLDNKPTQD